MVVMIEMIRFRCKRIMLVAVVIMIVPSSVAVAVLVSS